MNKLAITIAVSICAASVFLSMIPATPNDARAFSCSSSSSTHKLNIQTAVSGSSGSCSTSSGAGTSFTHRIIVTGGAVGPKAQVSAEATANPHGIQGAGSSSAGGGQSSCSSTTVTTSGGITMSLNSVSKSGACP